MLREQVLIDAGLVVEALQEAGGDQLDEVAIALLGFAKQHQVIVAVGVVAGLVALLRDVDLAADDRLHAFALGRVVELHRAEQVAVVGHGDGRHLLLDDGVHQLADFTGAIEQGVIGVAVQMDERVFRHGLPSIGSLGEVLLFYDTGRLGRRFFLGGRAGGRLSPETAVPTRHSGDQMMID